MTGPTSVMVECPVCKQETLHEVLSGKISGKSVAVIDSTVRCRECEHVHHVVMKIEKPVEVPVVISWLEKSKKSKVVLGPDEVVTVDDEIMCGEDPLIVTSMESNGARPRRAKARDIQTIWAKKFSKVRVPFSISHAGKSYSDHVLAVPDEEFYVGDIITLSRHEVVIHTIKTKGRVMRTGGTQAREIVRIYGNIVRKTSS
jgi:uncharacterized Zn finger protein